MNMCCASTPPISRSPMTTGSLARDYDRADIIMIGVSRSGKTPTCLYMAMQYGVFAANYPLTEDDLESRNLPGNLEAYKKKLFGLKTIQPERLQRDPQIERRPNSRYSSAQQVSVRSQGGGVPVRAARNSGHRCDGQLGRGNCAVRILGSHRHRTSAASLNGNFCVRYSPSHVSGPMVQNILAGIGWQFRQPDDAV